jgi:hypothetical protein
MNNKINNIKINNKINFIEFRNIIKNNEFVNNLLYTYDILVDKSLLQNMIYEYLNKLQDDILFNIKLIIYETLHTNKYPKYKYVKYIKNYTIYVYDYYYNDDFDFEIINNKLIITRVDEKSGWGLNLNIKLINNISEKDINVGNSSEVIKTIII